MFSFVSAYYKKFLLGVLFVSIFFFLLSIFEIAKGNITGFEPVIYGFGALLFGAFNWADVLIFSLLWIIISFILMKLKNKDYFSLMFYSFWLIRSTGEMIYSFLQQFHPETRPWLMYAPRAIMRNSFLGHFILVRYWVVEQVFFQSIAILSLFGLLYSCFEILKKKSYKD